MKQATKLQKTVIIPLDWYKSVEIESEEGAVKDMYGEEFEWDYEYLLNPDANTDLEYMEGLLEKHFGGLLNIEEVALTKSIAVELEDWREYSDYEEDEEFYTLLHYPVNATVTVKGTLTVSVDLIDPNAIDYEMDGSFEDDHNECFSDYTEYAVFSALDKIGEKYGLDNTEDMFDLFPWYPECVTIK